MRLDQITFTRFLAAISIFIFHYGKNIFPFDNESVSFIFKHAKLGVSYFFILSGFVMIIAYGHLNHISFRNYIQKRFSRIYPVYFIALVLVGVFYLWTDTSFEIKDLFLNLLMLQAWSPGSALSINSPGWSISVELLFYVSFPILFNLFYTKFSLKQLVMPIFIFFILSQAALHGLRYSEYYEGFPSSSHDFIFYFPLMHINEFLIGNLFGLLFFKINAPKNYDLWILGLVIALIVVFKIKLDLNYQNGLLAIFFAPLILFMSLNNGIITRFFNDKRLIFLGEISYGIYILQKPAFEWTRYMLGRLDIENSQVVFYSALGMLLIGASISYLFIETPLRNYINKRKWKRVGV